MPWMKFSEAIDRALAEAMAADERVVVFGEDLQMLRPELLARFGPGRILGAPISEAAFTAAGVGAAMAGLRPVVEIMIVDFIGCAMDAILNHMAKIETFSGGRWKCPMVIRAACGGGYGDGGQHEQTLWGMLAGIPGIAVIAPSNPAEAYGLMRSALALDGPSVFLEHKLLSGQWLDFLGRQGRQTLRFDVPAAGAEGEVPEGAPPIPLGSAKIVRSGRDITIVSLAVGVHRALEAAAELEGAKIDCEVIDLRTVRPLDSKTIVESAARTGRLVVVDEDYRECGLSGEIAAVVLEAGVTARYARVCLENTLPYARPLEDRALPNVKRVAAAARALME